MTSLQGDLKGIQLPEIFATIIDERRTGKLRIVAGSSQTCVYFVNGRIVYATGSETHQRIGSMLVQEGLIAAADRALATKMMMPGKRVGEILVQLGKLQSEDLDRILVKQVLSTCSTAFTLQGGSVLFNDGARIPEDLHLKALSTADIVMEGIRRMAVLDDMKVAVGSSGQPPKLTVSPIQVSRVLNLRQPEAQVLQRITGAAPLREILGAAGREADAYKVLYALRVLGLLDRGKAQPTRGTSPAGSTATEFAQVQQTTDLDCIYSRIGELDYYDILGVPDNASTGEIKRAYHQLAATYHPDRLGRTQSPEAVKKAERVFAKITEAYQTLIEDESRRAYDLAAPSQRLRFDAKAVRRPTTQVQTEAVERWAQGCYEKGMKCFSARMYVEAVQNLSQASKSSPRNIAYALALAWAHARNSATAAEAERAFVRAINIDKFKAEPCVEMGKYYMELKEYDKAMALFRRALALDDHHPEALDQISAIAVAQSKKRSIWDRVTGR